MNLYLAALEAKAPELADSMTNHLKAKFPMISR
jgi:hypothetical protein